MIDKYEKYSIEDYKAISNQINDIDEVIHDLSKHAEVLNSLLNENRLKYIGAIVLGLNDALVELTGTIAGLTFALANTRLVALSGIVTGISATLSMAASNYLAERAESNPDAFKSSVYTGVAYLITVVLMVLPYLIFSNDNYVYALILMLTMVIFIIIFFNYYISVAKSEPFLENFLTMAALSLGVALIAFVIGILAKRFLGVDI